MDSNKTLFVNPNYQLKVVEDGIFMLSELDQQSISGEAYQLVAPYLNGTHTEDEIITELLQKDSYAPLAEVYYVIATLKKLGYVIEGEALAKDSVVAFWDKFPRNGEQPIPDLPRTAKITDFSSTPEAAKALRKSLKSMGISVLSKGEIQIVLVDNYLDRRLQPLNEDAQESGQIWMPVKPSGRVVLVGPVFGQSDSEACFECLRKRLSANREVETFLMEQNPGDNHIGAYGLTSNAPLMISTNIAALEVSRFFAYGGTNKMLKQQMLSYSLPFHQTEQHSLVRRPQCAVCGEPEKHAEKAHPPVLKSVQKRFTVDGGHRTATPQETLKKYEHHISPLTGIVNNLSRITENEDMIHSYYAGHNSAAHYKDLFSLKNGLRSKAGGKGKSDIQAKVSGLCEAMERYSGLFEGYEKRIEASYNELGDDAIHPNECMTFSDLQFSYREDWNKIAGGFQTIPKKMDPDMVTDWSPVWSLTEQRYKYLPSAYLYFSYNRRKDQFFTWSDSNGNASGNVLEEAILQGFLELIERDAVALWWYNRIAKQGVDLESFEDPWMMELKARYKTLNRDIWALDLTSDFGIPVFAGISRRTDKEKEDIIVGFGAHFDAKVALTRALTEVNQFIPAVMDVPTEGEPNYRFDDPAMIYWWHHGTIENQPYIRPSADLPAKKWSDYPQTFSTDLLDDVKKCQELVESKGMEMLIMDQTRPDVEMPVVKVIVPGMRHFWARFGPGRLYDVPVEMGWLKKARLESELNPIPMFI